MAAETLRPDGELSDSGLVANSELDHDDDPDVSSVTIDATGNNVNTEWGGGFPTPTGNPTGSQEFRVGAEEFDGGQSGTPQARLELWENGVLVRAGSNTNISVYTVLSLVWDASELATVDGSLVQCKLIGTKSGGSPGKRNTVRIGHMEWNAEVGAAGPVTGAGSSDGTSTVAGDGISTAVADGAASGSGAVAGDGVSIAVAAGLSPASSTVAGAGIARLLAIGLSIGLAACAGTGVSTYAGDGTAVGASTVTGAGVSTSTGAGSSSGIATITGTGSSYGAGDGASVALAVVTGVGTATGTGAGASTGAAVAAATSHKPASGHPRAVHHHRHHSGAL